MSDSGTCPLTEEARVWWQKSRLGGEEGGMLSRRSASWQLRACPRLAGPRPSEEQTGQGLISTPRPVGAICEGSMAATCDPRPNGLPTRCRSCLSWCWQTATLLLRSPETGHSCGGVVVHFHFCRLLRQHSCSSLLPFRETGQNESDANLAKA
ncbi:unnamed protein product [Protopolystoma xenopodis]|uniref:Uncharacterized protein n=1 Tax=Protopolystoma xenopodis TaxID=117903 RepID=A0A3S5AF02_9PLAT|nr:unnamed protein product [Protopolystoma xenopodis]